MVGGYRFYAGKREPRRIRQPEVLSVRGEEVDALAVFVVLGRYTGVAVHRLGAKFCQSLAAIVSRSDDLQHQLP